MIAYKFLTQGAVSPFAGFRWPRPDGPRPGPWLSAAAAESRDPWIYACRLRDLPYWLDDELWRVELGDPTRETAYQIASARARLLARVEGWSRAGAQSFAEACALRTRDLAAFALASAGLEKDAKALRDCRELARLQAAPASPQAERLVGYVRDAAGCASSGQAATTSYIAAARAGQRAANPRGALSERAWQASWLAERLGL
jgi:hypothetical protein